MFQHIKYKITCLFMVSLVISGGIVRGQSVSVSARLDSTMGLIGDQLTLHLKVEKSPRAKVIFPRFSDTLTGKIEIVKKSAIDSTPGANGRIILRQDLLITVFDTGNFEIPPQSFAFQDGLLHDTLKTQPVFMTIHSLPMDTTLRNIRANMRTPLNAQEIFPYFLGTVGLALLVAALVYFIRKRKTKESGMVADVPSEPAEVIALRQLQQMKDEKPWIQRPVKMYYINLTDILRHYIERRFQIMALEQTTDEILSDLKKSANTHINLNNLASILKLADLVKFAKLIPGDAENETQVDEAISFVKNTVPVLNELTHDVVAANDPVKNNVEM
jgi:hypothetical protein